MDCSIASANDYGIAALSQGTAGLSCHCLCRDSRYHCNLNRSTSKDRGDLRNHRGPAQRSLARRGVINECNMTHQANAFDSPQRSGSRSGSLFHIAAPIRVRSSEAESSGGLAVVFQQVVLAESGALIGGLWLRLACGLYQLYW